MAVALAGLAATAALALLCFVKVVGLVLLGQPRRAECEAAVDPPAGMRVGMGLLALMCIALGLVPGLVLPTLAGLAPGAHGSVLARHAGLILPGTGSYLPLPLALALAALDRGIGRAARQAPRRTGAELGVRAAGRGSTRLELGGVHKAAAARARGGAAPAP